MIGAAILKVNASKIIISRSSHFKKAENANEIISIRGKTAVMGTITHLGMVEVNEITGKRVRDTIRVRSLEQLFAAVPQENAEEDIVHYDGSEWRVIAVRKNQSTWVSTAVRTGGKKEFCKDDTDTSVKPDSIRII